MKEPTLASIEKFVLNMINIICKIANFHQVICHSTTYQCFFLSWFVLKKECSWWIVIHLILTRNVFDLFGVFEENNTEENDNNIFELLAEMDNDDHDDYEQ